MNRANLYNMHRDLTSKALSLMEKKNQDYACEHDALTNFRVCDHLSDGSVPMSVGILIRLSDKLKRLYNLDTKDPAVHDESVEDTILDAINYLVIYAASRQLPKEEGEGEGETDTLGRKYPDSYNDPPAPLTEADRKLLEESDRRAEIYRKKQGNMPKDPHENRT